jgi:hypothetical protein
MNSCRLYCSFRWRRRSSPTRSMRTLKLSTDVALPRNLFDAASWLIRESWTQPQTALHRPRQLTIRVEVGGARLPRKGLRVRQRRIPTRPTRWLRRRRRVRGRAHREICNRPGTVTDGLSVERSGMSDGYNACMHDMYHTPNMGQLESLEAITHCSYLFVES